MRLRFMPEILLHPHIIVCRGFDFEWLMVEGSCRFFPAPGVHAVPRARFDDPGVFAPGAGAVSGFFCVRFEAAASGFCELAPGYRDRGGRTGDFAAAFGFGRARFTLAAGRFAAFLSNGCHCFESVWRW